MAQDDQFRTMRDVSEPVTEELSAVGFLDAQEIGRGGFGVVYRCTQVELDRTVAVKVLTAELDEKNQARFLREQRAMGRLTGHPNIVTVLQAGTTASGRPFLVMPFHQFDSLDARIRGDGPLAVETALWIGVKIAGALESAHRSGIVHRDVKPGNILLTDYGEPALTDFGIARIAGGFQTAAGTVTGSPAFTAPEVLEGAAPTAAADVYGLGATLFCALTGHAAFERRHGENVVTQFLRITSQPAPDLRESGVVEDVAAVVAAAMSRNPRDRPAAEALGNALRQAQGHLGLAVAEMALQSVPVHERRDHAGAPWGRRPTAAGVGRVVGGTLPLELTSFVGRRAEVAQLKNLLASTRLVTLTGIGGVGKTRLALRTASDARRQFGDRVWLVELTDVSDPALLTAVLAAALRLRDESTRPLPEVLTEFLAERKTLLVLDNCEHLVVAVAELVEILLRDCPNLEVLITSREPLDIAGEAVLRLSPLIVPDPEQVPGVRGLAKYDALTLFADRASALVPGFELGEGNRATVARICARLDGLPLAIELAAARMRTMSLEQILQRLDDRYALLTRGSRMAPTRQQTLRWCVDWSYGLCTSAEQRLWAQLSVFAGWFELDAAEQVCGVDLGEDPLNVLSALVDKSILIADDCDHVVRFRMLETMRDYGRQKLLEVGDYPDLRRRHRDWYQRLALDAEAGWIGDRQPYWIERLDREQPNLRDALEYCFAEDSEQAAQAGLRMTSALFMFWTFRGMYGEARSWIERALDHPARQPMQDRVKALGVGCAMAAMQGDLPSAAKLLEQGRALADEAPTPMNQALIAYGEGALQFYRGELALACASFERAAEGFDSSREQCFYVAALTVLGWVHELAGDTERAMETHARVLSITEACGESLFRASALRDMSVVVWRRGERSRAIQLVTDALSVNRRTGSPGIAALSFERLAWMVADGGDAERAAVLMGAAQAVWRSVGNAGGIFPMPQYHDDCVRLTRSTLGATGFDRAFCHGEAMSMDEAVSYALGHPPPDITTTSDPCVALTRRERQVADLIARGLTNKQIAAKLAISPSTARDHVQHLFSKLGFRSRTQIAAWIADNAESRNHQPS